MITLYAQLAGIVLALACVNALVRRAYRRRKVEPKHFLCEPGIYRDFVTLAADHPRMAEATCVADLGSAKEIEANAELKPDLMAIVRREQARILAIKFGPADMGSARAIVANGGER